MEVISLCSLLGVCAWEDWKSKEIHIGLVGLMGLAGMILHILRFRIGLLDILGGVAVGVALYLVSVASGEKIGKGDAFVFMGTGTFLGFWSNLFLLWGSFFLAGIVGIIYGAVAGETKDTRLPFLPFVFFSLLIQLCLGGLS